VWRGLKRSERHGGLAKLEVNRGVYRRKGQLCHVGHRTLPPRLIDLGINSKTQHREQPAPKPFWLIRLGLMERFL